MGALSMLLLTLGAGSVLLAIVWTAADGPRTANIRPAAVGFIMVCLGWILPLDSTSEASASISSPRGVIAPITNSLNLSIGSTVSARMGVACKTDAAGIATCWGADIPLPAGPVHKVVLGRAHGCALMQTGELSCWGGMADDADQRSGHRFVDAASTLHTTCGVTAQGALHCFGRDLGMPPSGHRLKQITGGADHFCALTETQQAYCWGHDTDGQLAAPEDRRFKTISAGHFHTCGITTQGHTSCWGRDTEGQASPPSVPQLSTISSGWAHTCGLTDGGEVVCWGCGGRHSDLQVGAQDACAPPPLSFATVVSGDLWESCGLTRDDAVACWGGIARPGAPE